jgi:hypothetical protein
LRGAAGIIRRAMRAPLRLLCCCAALGGAVAAESNQRDLSAVEIEVDHLPPRFQLRVQDGHGGRADRHEEWAQAVALHCSTQNDPRVARQLAFVVGGGIGYALAADRGLSASTWTVDAYVGLGYRLGARAILDLRTRFGGGLTDLRSYDPPGTITGTREDWLRTSEYGVTLGIRGMGERIHLGLAAGCGGFYARSLTSVPSLSRPGEREVTLTSFGPIAAWTLSAEF